MKKILLLLMILLLTGCDYVEINDLVIISGMIIDYKDNKYEITSQIIENENKSIVKVFTTKGESIEECLSELSKLSNKNLFMSHLKIIILTENIIKNKIDYQDYFLRDTKSKMNFYVYYIEGKYKDEILKLNETESSSFYIKDLMDFNNKIFSSSTPVSFLDLIYKQKEFGISEVYPNVTIKKNDDKDVLYLQNIVMFNDNNEKIILNDNESIFFNMLINKLNKTTLNIPCEENDFSITINNSNTKFKWNNNILNINIKIKSKLSSYNCKYSLNDVDTMQKLSELLNENIKSNINNVVNISVNNKIDFIGIGNYIYKHDKNYFNFENDNIIEDIINDKIKPIKREIRVAFFDSCNV